MSKSEMKHHHNSAQPHLGKSLHLARLFPNMVTLLGLCAGLSSMRWALDARWELSVAFIVIAAVIDALDGRLARLLHSTSTFGAQLDSLADFVNFGVAPAFMMYLWLTHEIKGLGWALVLFSAICCAIRLARFNTDLDEEGCDQDDVWSSNLFFVGVPAPAAALLTMAPLVITFAFARDFPEIMARLSFVTNPWFVCMWVAAIALLMASRLPTFSFKKISIKREYASLILVTAGLCMILMITEPWLSLLTIGIIYCLTIVSSTLTFCRMKNQGK